MKTLTSLLTRRSCLITSPDSVEVVAHLCHFLKCGRQEQCACVRACDCEREGGREREIWVCMLSCVDGESQACLSALLLKSWMCSMPCVLEIKVHVVSMLPRKAFLAERLHNADVQIQDRSDMLMSCSQPGSGFRPVQHTQRPPDPLVWYLYRHF